MINLEITMYIFDITMINLATLIFLETWHIIGLVYLESYPPFSALSGLPDDPCILVVDVF